MGGRGMGIGVALLTLLGVTGMTAWRAGGTAHGSGMTVGREA